MKIFYLLMICLLLITTKVWSQKDSTKTDDLLNSLNSDNSKIELLPQKMLITQRALWGNKGLMRNFKAFELTTENREKELKIRRTMLVIHQILGTVTLAQMVGQGVVGMQLYNGKDVRDLHEGLAMGINITYFSTAAMALFAPPKMLSERKGYSSIKVHKWLAVVHFTSMIATNILASQLEGNPSVRPWHRAAAFTAFGSFAAAMIVIKF